MVKRGDRCDFCQKCVDVEIAADKQVSQFFFLIGTVSLDRLLDNVLKKLLYECQVNFVAVGQECSELFRS